MKVKKKTLIRVSNVIDPTDGLMNTGLITTSKLGTFYGGLLSIAEAVAIEDFEVCDKCGLIYGDFFNCCKHEVKE
jgi:hypothetical protein